MEFCNLGKQLDVVIDTNTKDILIKDFPEIKKVEVVLAKEIKVNDVIIFDYFIDSRNGSSRPPSNMCATANALLTVEAVVSCVNTVNSWQGVVHIPPTQMDLHYVVNCYGITSDKMSIENLKREIGLSCLSEDSFSQERGNVKCDLNMRLLRVLQD